MLLALVKPLVLLSYLSFGAFLIWMASGRKLQATPAFRLFAVLFIAAAGLLFVRFSLIGPVFPASVIGATVLFCAGNGAWKSPRLLAAVFAVVAAATSLAWWLLTEGQPRGWWRIVVFVLLAGFLYRGLTHSGGKQDGEKAAAWGSRLLCAAFCVVGALLLANAAPFRPGSDALVHLAHHYGAYIGSAIHVRAGLVPFYDIPLQYGLGPTLTIAAACGVTDCWTGVQFLTVATSTLLGLLILCMALSGRPSRSSLWRLSAALVVFVSVFFWPGMPDIGPIAAALPSVGGMRFLPMTLVGFFLFFGMPRLATTALIPAVLWSPEVAVMSIVVFGVHEIARLGPARALGRIFAITGGSYLALILIHHQFYGVWMQPDVMAEYILHVPGPLPIDPLTDFVYLALALALAAWIVRRKHASAESFRQDLVATSLLFASVSYYLGRSHPNNICNLMPFIALVGLRAMAATDERPVLRRLTSIGLATSAAAVVLSFWNYVPFRYEPESAKMPMRAAIETLDPEMNTIRARIDNPDHLGIADIGIYLNRHPAETVVWTPMDPFSLWAYVPAERRRLYIRRSAERLRLGGWMILQGDAAAGVLDDFRAAYSVEDEVTYVLNNSNYTVVRLVPLQQRLAADRPGAGEMPRN